MASLKTEESMKVFECVSCGVSQPVPYHCGKPMIIENDRLVCWKGEHAPCCKSTSVRDIPIHHGERMVLKE